MSAGDLLVVGIPGPSLDDATRGLLRRIGPGGVILFRHNVESEDQLVRLVDDLRRTVPDVLLFVDGEGGRVDRLAPIVGPSPSGGELAAAPPAMSERAGRWVGQSLRHFGFDVDFAPVVDLDRGERDNALEGRYLGSTPRTVTARGRAFLRGLHGAGIGGCVKHFPGLGGAREDTHDRPSVVDLRRPELERDLGPFRRLLPVAGAVMLAHASYPDVDPDGRPASVSRPIVTGLLREELGFRGLVVTDDLDMKALEPWGDHPTLAAEAVAAGCDAIPICRSLEGAPEVADRLGVPELKAAVAGSRARWRRYRQRLASLRREAPRHGIEVTRRRLAELSESVSV